MSGEPTDARQAAADRGAVAADLDLQGWAVLPGLVRRADCDGIAALYDVEAGFRYPLPPIVFAVRTRLVRGARGECRVALRHGVSRLRAGRRHTLVIFHDAA